MFGEGISDGRRQRAPRAIEAELDLQSRKERPRFEGVPHGPGRNVVDDADAPAINNKAKASGRQGAFDLALSEELALRRGRAVR